MGGLAGRAVAALAAVGVLLGSAAGVASAGQAPALSWSPTISAHAYTFLAIHPGETASQVFTLTNSGGPASSPVKAGLTGAAAFTKTADACTGKLLGSGASCTVTVQFAPAGYGEIDTARLIARTGTTVVRLALYGRGAKDATHITTSPGAGGPVGGTVTDTATLSGGSSPTGSITFTLYGPSATADCSTAAVDTEQVTVSGDGSYTTPAGAIPARAGTYWWTARYHGDAQNKSSATACGSEPVTIVPASPGITTSQQPASAGMGSAVADQATVTGGFSPTGTVTFTLYGNDGCTGSPLFTDTENLSGGTATSAGYTATSQGTDYWVAAYSGDANNNPVTSGCADEPVTITLPIPGLSTSPSAGGAVGTGVTDTATLSGGDNPTGTITFNLYGPSATADCSTTPVDTEQVTVTGDGRYLTPVGAAPAQPGTYWWTASYSGDQGNGAVASGCGAESVTLQAKVYWADSGGSIGSIRDSNLDGSDVTTLVPFQTQPAGVAVGNDQVYWASNTESSTNGTIMEFSLAGTGVSTLVTGLDAPSAVAVDASHVYWTTGAGAIMESGLDGTGVTTLVTGHTGLGGLAVDSSHLYWTTGAGTIMESNLDGTGVSTLVTGLSGPQGLAVDSSHLYWTEPGSGTIMQANLDGTGVTTLVTGQGGADGVAVDSSHLYWTDPGVGTIMESALDGTGVTTLVTGQATPIGVAVNPS